MEKKIVYAGKLHIFQNKYYWRFFLYEYPCKEYLWLSAWIRSNHRGNGIYQSIKKAIFHRTPGLHHIHFFPDMKTTKQMADQMKWKYIGESKLFEGCFEYRYQFNNTTFNDPKIPLEHIVHPFSIDSTSKIPVIGLSEILFDFISNRENNERSAKKESKPSYKNQSIYYPNASIISK